VFPATPATSDAPFPTLVMFTDSIALTMKNPTLLTSVFIIERLQLNLPRIENDKLDKIIEMLKR
jgi:hypothetical protein